MLVVSTLARIKRLIKPFVQLLVVYGVATATVLVGAETAYGPAATSSEAVGRAVRAAAFGLFASFAAGKTTPKVVRRE